MKKQKRFISLLLVLVMVLTVFTACGNQNTGADDSETTTHAESSQISSEETTIQPATTETTTAEETTSKKTTTEKSTTETTVKQTTTKKSTISEPIIPDPGAYLRLARNEEGSFGSADAPYYCISYKTDLSYPQALQEYITLISKDKYQFELVHKYERPDHWSFKEYHYYFNYTGEKDIPDLIHPAYDDAVSDLIVTISYFPADKPGEYDHAYLSLNYNPDAPFKLVDTGDRTVFPLRDLSYIY